MILREYDIEEIDYQPGKYRVIETLGASRKVLYAGTSWLLAQAIAAALETARQHFIEDNRAFFSSTTT